MSVEYTILRCLIVAPSHGYLLQRRLATFSNFYPLSNVNVYPALKELEERGYVTSSTEVVDARARRTYFITECGKEAFEAWMASPPETFLPEIRDETQLRLALALHENHDLSWLPEAIEAAATQAEQVSAIHERYRGQLAPMVSLAVDELVSDLEHRRVFLEKTLALSRKSGSESGS